jgi:SAM-dependent methyltransferase
MTLLEGEPTGWPFFAPSEMASVEAALDLVGLRPGDRFADLGCGDGQVLVAAARRGARVLGVEIDEDLAEAAREALAANDLAGEVVVADLFDLDLDLDVVFTYLSPATLQRLLPRLRRQRGLRLVTVDFPVPDLVPATVRWPTHLYRMPGRLQRPRAPGWTAAGALVVTVADRPSLTCLEARTPGGPVELVVSAGLRRAGTFQLGADEVGPGRAVALDVRWEPHPEGTVVHGTVSLPGLAPHPVVVAFTDDPAAEGAWDLSDEGAAQLLTALRRRKATRPRTPAELLAAATA